MRPHSPEPEAHAPEAAGAGECRRARPLLGTIVEIRARAAHGPGHGALDAAFAAIERIHALMSYHDPHSDLSRLNRLASRRPVDVESPTYAVLVEALRIAALSAGAFDPTIGHALEDLGQLPRHRGARRVPAANHRARADWRAIELLGGCRVRFRAPLRIDLGGIAKGYAVDAAVRVLNDAGIDDVLVNAGGDLRVSGPRPWPVALRDPLDPRRLSQALELRDASIATSAPTYSRRPGARGPASALFDPRAHRACVVPVSVSVIARDCAVADALTKVVLFAPPHVARRTLAALDAHALVQGGGTRLPAFPTRGGTRVAA